MNTLALIVGLLLAVILVSGQGPRPGQQQRSQGSRGPPRGLQGKRNFSQGFSRLFMNHAVNNLIDPIERRSNLLIDADLPDGIIPGMPGTSIGMPAAATYTVCPKPLVLKRCHDPCRINFCNRFPYAKCIANYCGGCTAEFYAPHWRRITNCDNF